MDKDDFFKKLSTPEEKQEFLPAENQPDDGIKTIHTLKSDIAEAVKKEGLSYSKIAAAEAERQRKMEGLVIPPKKKVVNILLIVVSLVFLLIGAGAVFAAVLYFKNAPSSSKVLPNSQSIFTSEYNGGVVVNTLDRQSIILAINAERKKQFPSKQIKFVTLSFNGSTTTSPISIASLSYIFTPNLEGQSVRSLKDNYQFGFYNVGETNNTFLILHTDSYEDTYGGMLEWEKYIAQDLAGFMVFPRMVISSSTASTSASIFSPATSSATTTPAATSTATTTAKVTIAIPTTTKMIPLKVQFEDEVVGNKDARVLRDTTGNTTFLYSFLDQQTLVFATSEETLQEIQNRIISAKRVQ